MSLPDALERAATALPECADAVRDANGDPSLLLETLRADAAAKVLAWLLEHEPGPADELCLGWCETEAGAAALQSIDPAALAKAGRKTLRRALHRLRSRGVETAATSAGAPVVARLPEIDESISAALVTPLDPRGARMAYLLEPHPAGGARLYEMVLDDARGIVEFKVYSAGRSRVRSFLKEVASRGRTATLDVEPDQVRALLVRALAAQPADRPAPRAFIEHRSQLALEVASGTPTPGAAAEAALGPVAAEQSLVEHAASLVRNGTIGPWPPAVEILRAIGDDVKEGLGGSVIVSAATREERSREVLGEAAARLYDAAGSAVAASRLRESAYALWKQASEDDARACLAAALLFDGDAGGGAENPVALAFVEVMLAPLLTQLAEEGAPGAGAEESRVVTP